jgi:methylated-DNA-[protein]-cysteine S-methyltransferase
MIVPELAPIEYRTFPTAIGDLTVAGDSRAVRFVHFERNGGPRGSWIKSRGGVVRDAQSQLEEYLERGRRVFDVPLAPRGTSFQQSVWEQLRRIPYGETVSYGELARRIGQPTASRAVGAANGANPIPILVPCHRAVGADGSMTGFGGGIAVKRMLLALESGQRALTA